ncbi:hypothetical protein HD806DRAFT_532170 [Xylariaceae sp. AK1471]|nr:hypothetical protein HD806DRAFT_532170 [Xylariaceae sp. AK1471]
MSDMTSAHFSIYAGEYDLLIELAITFPVQRSQQPMSTAATIPHPLTVIDLTEEESIDMAPDIIDLTEGEPVQHTPEVIDLTQNLTRCGLCRRRLEALPTSVYSVYAQCGCVSLFSTFF